MLLHVSGIDIFLLLSIFSVWTYYSWFIYLSVDGFWGCFWFLATMSKAVINIFIYNTLTILKYF